MLSVVRALLLGMILTQASNPNQLIAINNIKTFTFDAGFTSVITVTSQPSSSPGLTNYQFSLPAGWQCDQYASETGQRLSWLCVKYPNQLPQTSITFPNGWGVLRSGAVCVTITSTTGIAIACG